MNPAQPFLEVCKRDSNRLAIVEIGGRKITRGTLLKRVYGMAGSQR